jgi:hypothetical protein
VRASIFDSHVDSLGIADSFLDRLLVLADPLLALAEVGLAGIGIADPLGRLGEARSASQSCFDDHAGLAHPHLGLRVDDVRAPRAELGLHGLRVLRDDVERVLARRGGDRDMLVSFEHRHEVRVLVEDVEPDRLTHLFWPHEHHHRLVIGRDERRRPCQRDWRGCC